MRVPANRAPAPPPRRRLSTIAVLGVAVALLVLAAGAVAEMVVLGRDATASRARVEREVREAFDGMARDLRTVAAGVADVEVITAAAAGDTAATRRLFDAAGTGLGAARADEFALTVYAADGQPIAWGGRPSDLPRDRIQGDEAWFFAQGALGLRLIYIMPVTTDGGVRIAAIAVERALTPAADSADDVFEFPTRFTRVAIALNFESAATRPAGDSFEVQTPAGGRLLTATVSAAQLAQARARWRTATRSLAIVTLAIVLMLLGGPLLEWRNHARQPSTYLVAALLVAVTIVGARGLLTLASPADWSAAPVFSATAYASPLLAPLLRSPFDLLATALVLGAMVALGLFGVEAWRIAWRQRRRPLDSWPRRVAFVGLNLAAGVLLALLCAAHLLLLRDTIANATVDVLHFSLHPWDTARVALESGLVIWHASVIGAGVLLLRAVSVPWRLRHDATTILGTAVVRGLPLGASLLASPDRARERAPLLIALTAVIVLAALATRLKARYRHGSQAFRLAVLTAGLVAPALVFYPSVFQLGRESKIELVETRLAPQAINQRQTIQQVLRDSLQEIDRFPGIADLIAADAAPADSDALTDRAFQLWRITGLAAYPITSSVELYGSDGALLSRYAFNLPEDLSTVPASAETSCDWQIFEEVSPFFAEERRVLHAGRTVCVQDASGGTRRVGSIVVHAMLDYANLPFISSQNPYVELLRPAPFDADESETGRGIEYVVYGWSRRPIYASKNTAWDLDDDTFATIAASREPHWAPLARGDERFDVLLMNDRFGVYALGFPVVSPLGHLVNLAELIVLGAGTFVALLILNVVFGVLSRRRTSARELLREVRASFYRKLFLAFVAAAVVPVVILAVLTRNYLATQMEGAVEQEAVRTVAAARRVIEDLVAPRVTAQAAGVDDNLMVWVSRLIDQDVNIFRASRLQATSERNLFASGLLPRRTPAGIYSGLALRSEAATVIRERIGAFEYLVAGTPVTTRQIDAILTVPLTSRQQEIEDQIDLLNRQVLLGALLFILAGAGLGYSLAERIADPVSRLTRATRRIARGELDVRVAATSSDELRRLVDDFNSMATELERQRRELERTHRLEAWAEMSRQVAHDIKNPLTPIQLNAEHLRRVHADRGEPLSPVLEECVANILTQVKLLRQIASEFSSFASSPTARPSPVDSAALLHEIVDPYVIGLSDRIRFDIDIPATLPAVQVDRGLVGRALTNIIENALHAMPGRGTLTVAAAAEGSVVRIRVGDTGSGMDPEALARAFEPYFSTKATGTGLGLPIAKRNIELNGGEIGITTGPAGTTVEVTLPTERNHETDEIHET